MLKIIRQQIDHAIYSLNNGFRPFLNGSKVQRDALLGNIMFHMKLLEDELISSGDTPNVRAALDAIHNLITHSKRDKAILEPVCLALEMLGQISPEATLDFVQRNMTRWALPPLFIERVIDVTLPIAERMILQSNAQHSESFSNAIHFIRNCYRDSRSDPERICTKITALLERLGDSLCQNHFYSEGLIRYVEASDYTDHPERVDHLIQKFSYHCGQMDIHLNETPQIAVYCDLMERCFFIEHKHFVDEMARCYLAQRQDFDFDTQPELLLPDEKILGKILSTTRDPNISASAGEAYKIQIERISKSESPVAAMSHVGRLSNSRISYNMQGDLLHSLCQDILSHFHQTSDKQARSKYGAKREGK